MSSDAKSNVNPYEFNEEQSRVITGLGRSMRIVGIVGLAWAAVEIISMAILAWKSGGLYLDLNPILAIFIGVWALSGGTSFLNAATTQGNDIVYLMDALSKLRSIFGLIAVLIIVALVITLAVMAYVLIAHPAGAPPDPERTWHRVRRGARYVMSALFNESRPAPRVGPDQARVPLRGAVMLLLAAVCSISARAGELDPWNWQPRAGSINLERTGAEPGTPGSGVVLRVRGRITGGWNYVATDRHPVTPGGFYRLSVWLRVDRRGPQTPMPYLKCEFVGEGSRTGLGQVHTQAYQSPGPGPWQELTSEFQVPAAARFCWLALEKGTNAPTEIDARLRDIRLQPIAGLTALLRYRLDPRPAKLEAVRGVHPRIYLNDRRIAQLRAAISSSHEELWKKIRTQADRAVRRGPPAYVKDNGQSGDEQLWQREVGNTLPLLAMAYVVTGEKAYLEAARRWALASCNYKTWGLGRIDGMDLAAGHQLYGLGLVYDWCNRDLDDEARQTIRRTLIKRASAMYRAAATGSVWWHRSYLQNHLWVNITGLAVAGLALFDEVEEASGWIGLPLEKFRETMAALGPDGASHEGVGYWEYGVEYMLKFADLSRSLLGVELTGNDWWRNTASYALYLTLPRGAWRRDNCIVDLADCPRGHWYGPDYLLRELAHLHHDGHAQWLAEQVDRTGVASAEAAWLNLLWFDPSVLPVPPDRLPTLRQFADMGIISAAPAGQDPKVSSFSSADRSSVGRRPSGSPTIQGAVTSIPTPITSSSSAAASG